jgi:hypothetical protein
MDNDNLTKYEIYKWTAHDLKMYACKSAKLRKNNIYIFGVSDSCIATKEANYMKEFNTLTIFAKVRFREW